MKEYNDAMTTIDTITHIGEGSLIHHGKQSDRIYLMKLAPGDTQFIADELIRLAEKHNYSKIFCAIPKKAAPLFFAKGYIMEGYIPYYYNGTEDMFYVSKFMTPERLSLLDQASMADFSQLLRSPIEWDITSNEDQQGYSIKRLHSKDVDSIVEIYCDIFESYPFPIQDAAYIKKTMQENVQYFGAFKNGDLAALAACEIDFESKNAEMTDFATHRAHTGRRLACLLLKKMEAEMQNQGIMTLYSIARMNSISMNKTFLRFGYQYSGTLINNTHIAGQIETMNLYYKNLFRINSEPVEK